MASILINNRLMINRLVLIERKHCLQIQFVWSGYGLIFFYHRWQTNLLTSCLFGWIISELWKWWHLKFIQLFFSVCTYEFCYVKNGNYEYDHPYIVTVKNGTMNILSLLIFFTYEHPYIITKMVTMNIFTLLP